MKTFSKWKVEKREGKEIIDHARTPLKASLKTSISYIHFSFIFLGKSEKFFQLFKITSTTLRFKIKAHQERTNKSARR